MTIYSIVVLGTIEADSFEDAEAAMLEMVPLDAIERARVTQLRATVHPGAATAMSIHVGIDGR